MIMKYYEDSPLTLTESSHALLPSETRQPTVLGTSGLNITNEDTENSQGSQYPHHDGEWTGLCLKNDCAVEK